ncbi:hypothetical protein HPB49_005106 [Dermacentor silvarum]|uniref:Uncharacterized protein n=1 Tax=Dermacentor silvarum TaxID=543639 RepID=A0ACB8CQ11_DERSI|nr:hypothetical protein HPB49_005106 [Dermacentor silvarum]
MRCARYSRYVPYWRPCREISRCRELKNMAATDSKTSGSVVMAASKSRVHFGIALDLELLAYVRSLNPFADPVQWTVIAAKMQDIAGMPSGLEEQYSTREALLQELLDLSREHGVQIRRRRIGNAAPVPRDRCTLAPEAEQKSAAAKRDAAAAMNVATQPSSGSYIDCGKDGETAAELFNKMLQNEEEYNEAGAELDSQLEEVDSQHGDGSGSSMESRSQATPSPSDSQTLLSATKAASQVDSSHVSTSQAAVRTEPVRGKKRQEQAADFEFLERRMHHDLLMKEKECAMEARRLALEERRLDGLGLSCS